MAGAVLEHRIADRRVLRLIQKWLAAGAIEKGSWTAFEEGVPQGASVSPLLANVYAHYVLDLWAHQWRTRHAHGEVIIVRWADDFVVGFEHREDAERFWSELRDRLATFGLELNAEKTRLIEFGRHAARNRKARGLGKPETFQFLGFTHVCGTTRKTGRFKLKRITDSKRVRAKLLAVKREMARRMHQPIPEQGRWLARVLQGHYNYYAVPDNVEALGAFRKGIIRHWLKTLRRRGQRHRLTWERIGRLARPMATSTADSASLARAAIRRHHPRQEPSAVVPHAGICAGGGRRRPSLPQPIRMAGRAGNGRRRRGMTVIGAVLVVSGVGGVCDASAEACGDGFGQRRARGVVCLASGGAGCCQAAGSARMRLRALM